MGANRDGLGPLGDIGLKDISKPTAVRICRISSAMSPKLKLKALERYFFRSSDEQLVILRS
jgi:hypothetical protein